MLGVLLLCEATPPARRSCGAGLARPDVGQPLEHDVVVI
jgi:hypothetical protein